MARKRNLPHSRTRSVIKTLNERLTAEFSEFYSKNIHITRTTDEFLSSKSDKWAALPKERRYKLIHIGLGVQILFEYAETIQDAELE